MLGGPAITDELGEGQDKRVVRRKKMGSIAASVSMTRAASSTSAVLAPSPESIGRP